MALTPSTMLALGTSAPDFSLRDTVSGQVMSLASFSGKKALLVIFMCNHCPYVKHLKGGLVQLGKDYDGQSVAIVAISSNDAATHPEDAPEKLGMEAKSLGYRFPVLYDETQRVAQAYQAACTPDFYVFDPPRNLAYRGQFDASRPGNGLPVTGSDIRAALDAVLGGSPAPPSSSPAWGATSNGGRETNPPISKDRTAPGASSRSPLDDSRRTGPHEPSRPRAAGSAPDPTRDTSRAPSRGRGPARN